MKTLLITGGAGFIGSKFIKYMLNKYSDYKIINLDLLTYAGNLKNLIDIKDNPNYKFIHGNVCEQSLVEQIVSSGVNYIINFAAESHVDKSIKDPKVFIETNILGTQILLDIARKFNIDKYIQISTDEVYGTLGKEGLFTEKSPLRPNNPYSASKASADLLTRSYYKTYGLPVNVTRCSNNYGPNQHPEKLIPLTIMRSINGNKIPIYGDGLQIRDWIHVRDHCYGIDLVLHEGQIGEIYNIGDNNEMTNINVVKNILDILNKSENLIQHVKDRVGHDERYAIDSSKIKTELGWKTKYTFERGLRETINWYLNNFDVWRK